MTFKSILNGVLEVLLRKKNINYALVIILATGGTAILSGSFIFGLINQLLIKYKWLDNPVNQPSEYWGFVLVILAIIIAVFDTINTNKAPKQEPLANCLTLSEEIEFNGNKIIVANGPIDQISNVDVIATSENDYLQLAKFESPSTSGRIRKASATRSPNGNVIKDHLTNGLSNFFSVNFGINLSRFRHLV